ncbi:TetR family transcriptional regulator [Geodermatophilus sp. DSM 44513]|uniref:TetR/AcrR family transcriptional regulator n=1 Tax=Geodermatophilus sp. DSM 44513 TaxID=1528104 RepID=UPI0012808EB1|nr:TetR family transcriptional regulator [Geodermatophilus sp. DSM 44513]WNV75152.1 TetR family transcriptional regulator [Geodermatophilus sp. DSM 44513]
MQDTVLFYPGGSNGEDFDGARAERKAQTRSDLRRVAQQLFADRGFDAVTIASIAAAASVSVQTVFNHFSSKEELFFDGRASWVDGPADAVRFRAAGVPALTALRHHLVEWVPDRVAFEAAPEGRRYTSAVETSSTLSIRERELVHDAERRLSVALADAWEDDGLGAVTSPPSDPAVAARVTAATWLATVRVLVTGERQPGGSTEQRAADVAALTDRLLRGLEG